MKHSPLLALIQAELPIRCRNALASGVIAWVLLVSGSLGLLMFAFGFGYEVDLFKRDAADMVVGRLGMSYLGIAFLAFLIGGCLRTRFVPWCLLVGFGSALVGVAALIYFALARAPSGPPWRSACHLPASGWALADG